MNVIVSKFGGNLLKDESNRFLVVNKIKNKLKKGTKIILIVSAMGRMGDPYATDTLLEYAKYLNDKDKDRLISQGEIISSLILANQIAKENISVHPLTEREIGIITNSEWGNGKVVTLNPLKINKLFSMYDVLVIPGFIGMNKNGDVVTLGRGGSDFSAVIIAHMLGIPRIEVYKDVDGVLSGDPKFVKNPHKFDFLSYQQMQILSEHGAQILQTNAIIAAYNYNIELEVIPLFTNEYGTLISHKPCGDKFIATMSNSNSIFVIGNIVKEDTLLIDKLMAKKYANYQIIPQENVIKVIINEGNINEINNYLHSMLISNVNKDLGIYFSGD